MPIFLLLASLLNLSCAHGAKSADPLPTIRDRVERQVLESVPVADQPTWALAEIASYRSHELPDGSFSDLDYYDQQGPHWGPVETLGRAFTFLLATRLPGSPYFDDAAIRELGMRAIRFYASRPWWHYNWWTMEIGMPLVTYRILAIYGDRLPAELRDSLLAATRMGNIVTHPSRWPVTGANAIWYAEISIALGAIDGNPGVIQAASNAIARELRQGNREGIQVDYTFYQHGPLFYNGSYAISFLASLPNLAESLAGTPFAIAKANVDLLTDFILDGELWMAQGSIFDYSSQGRTYARVNGASVRALLPACVTMARIPGGRQTEFQRCAETLADGTTRFKLGNRLFWKGDFMTHNRAGFGISVRMNSRRTLNSDTSPNGEGLRSEYLADGMNYVYRTGAEVANIHPVLDYFKLPGVTMEVLPAYPPVKDNNYSPHYGATNWAGGVSDGDVGLATLDFRRTGLSARKSWFFFDGGMVALGAGVKSSGKYPVVTTLNQEWSKSPMLYATAADPAKVATLDSGKTAPAALKWAHANDVGYLFVGENEATLKNEVQTGSWRLLGFQLPSTPVAGKVASLWLNHSKALDHYAYAVLPGLSTAETAAASDRAPFTVLSNTTDVQAVEFAGAKMVEAAFFSGGELRWGNSSLESNRPAAVLFRQSGAGCSLTVSNPDQVSRSVKIRWRYCPDGQACPAADPLTKTVDFVAADEKLADRSKTFAVSCR